MALFDRFRKTSSQHDPLTTFYNRDQERIDRLIRYSRAWDAYLAETPNTLKESKQSDDNIKVNPSRAIINSGVYFLFGDPPKFEASREAADKYGITRPMEDMSDSGVERFEDNPEWLQALNRAWKANRKESWCQRLGLSGAIHGTPFVRIVPNALGLNNEFPRLILLDPATVDVETDPNDYEMVTKYTISYIVDSDDTVTPPSPPKMLIEEITPNVNEFGVPQSWSIREYEQEMGFLPGQGWSPLVGQKFEKPDAASEWPYAWAPIDQCQNMEVPHQFWGLPDMDDAAIDVVEALQQTMSSLKKIVRIHASPRMFAKGVHPDQVGDIDVSADNIITLPNMEAGLDVLNTLSNLSPSIEFTDKIREDLYEMIQTPPIALGKFDPRGSTMTGVNMSILYAPLLQKTDMKRSPYGDLLMRLNHKMLQLMGFTDPDIQDYLVIVWPEPMPGSAYLERQTLETDKQLGVSEWSIIQNLGYDPEEEQIRRLHERQLNLELDARYQQNTNARASDSPDFVETRGGNNNPTGFGNNKGSMGGIKAAGVPKAPTELDYE